MKQLTKTQMAIVKRTAANTKALRKKCDILENKIQEYQTMLQEFTTQIDLFEAPIKALSGGFDSHQILSGECFTAEPEESINVDSMEDSEDFDTNIDVKEDIDACYGAEYSTCNN